MESINFKNIKVLCVIKDDQVLTRVVRQDPVIYPDHYQYTEHWGPLKIKSVNTPELRSSENILFLRGDQRHADHRIDNSYYEYDDIDNLKSMIQEVNNYYHENISIQNPNS